MAQVGATFVVTMALGTGVAQALPGGPWASQSSPLTASYCGNSCYTAAAAYGTFQGYREDQGRGSRIQNSSFHREPTHISGAHGAFVNHHWYSDGDYCYLTSFSDSGASVSCQSGWHDMGVEDRTG